MYSHDCTYWSIRMFQSVPLEKNPHIKSYPFNSIVKALFLHVLALRVVLGADQRITCNGFVVPVVYPVCVCVC